MITFQQYLLLEEDNFLELQYQVLISPSWQMPGGEAQAGHSSEYNQQAPTFFDRMPEKKAKEPAHLSVTDKWKDCGTSTSYKKVERFDGSRAATVKQIKDVTSD